MLLGWCVVTASDVIVFPAEMIVVPRPVVLVGPSFVVTDPYVETVWLPIIGPSSTWMLRRLAAWCEFWPDGSMVVLAELSEALGLTWSASPGSKVQHTLRRLVRFGLADWSEVLAVATLLPPVSERQLARLSPSLIRTHDQLLAAAMASNAA